MHAEFIISIVLFVFLRSHANTKTLDPKWSKYFWYGILMSAGILVIGSAAHQVKFLRGLMVWISHFVIYGLVYLSQTRKEFEPLRPYAKVVLPVVIVHTGIDFLNLIPIPGFGWLQGIFTAAESFVFFWFFGALIMVKRQQNALEKEKIKSIEQEKEIKKSEEQSMWLEEQIAERTAEITQQKEVLVHALDDLRATQDQLIHAEKMASLGELTAGIAHEIQNPLNFVNNFSEVNKELLVELKEEIGNGNYNEVYTLADDIISNEEKIMHHGKRADSIVKGMLKHSRTNNNEKVATDINELCDEYLRLAYHGLRAKDSSFNANFETDFDDSIGEVMIVTQDMSRVILNLITNGFQSISHKSGVVKVTTRSHDDTVTIAIKDNGVGIPDDIIDKIFQPFFTTKPTGQGTGLGLSLSYEIVIVHESVSFLLSILSPRSLWVSLQSHMPLYS